MRPDEASSRLKEFIEAWKKYPALLPQNRYEDNAWYIRDAGQLGSATNYIYFSSRNFRPKSLRKDRTNPRPSIIPEEMLMHEPFLSFAKSLIIYLSISKPTVTIAIRLTTIKILYESLLKITGSYCPTKITAEILEQAAEEITENFAPTTSSSYLAQLGQIYRTILSLNLYERSFTWSPPTIKKSRRTRFGKQFDIERNRKLPDPMALEALAEIFTSETSDKCCMVSSAISALLISNPSRVIEVLHLPLEILIDDVEGITTPSEAPGMIWYPAKGGMPTIKPLIAEMAPVVRQAIDKLKVLSQPARLICIWYESNPKSIYLPPSLECLRGKEYINYKEAFAILFSGEVRDISRPEIARVRNTLRRLEIPFNHTGNQPVKIKFSSLEKAIINQLPREFPIFDPRTGAKFSESLLIQRRQEYRSDIPFNCIIERISYSILSKSLTTNKKSKNKSIFEKLNYRDRNGNHLTITTHMFRHYLNTLANQTLKLTEEEIAAWSGRKSTLQNSVYNHQSDFDVINILADALDKEKTPLSPFPDMANRNLIAHDQFKTVSHTAAHITMYGHCLHDYLLSPCQAAGGCVNCDEHVCIKGDKRGEENLYRYKSELQELVDSARLAFNQKVLGAAEWFKFQTDELSRVNELIDILESPTTPEGAIIRASSISSPSRFEIASGKRDKIHQSLLEEPKK